MLRRLLLGYLGLLLVVLAAFGVPFGILWANHARADELGGLQQSATEAGAAVSPSLVRAFAGRLTLRTGRPVDPDELGDGLVAMPRLSAAERAALVGALSDFANGSRTLVALIGGGGQVVASLGADRSAAPRILTRRALVQAFGQSPGQATTGQADVVTANLIYAAVPVHVPLPDPTEPGTATAVRERPGIPVAAVVVGEPAGVVADRVRTIAASLAALGAAILVLAAFAGWALVRSLVRPLKQIELAVTELGSGDLTARAPTGHGPPELVELAETVNVMAGQLGELITAQRAFVADASHQLRTPLTALRLRLESLAAGEPTPPEELGAILSEVERLARLVTGLLGLARAEEAPVPPTVTDVSELVVARGEVWQSVAEEQGVTLVSDADDDRFGLVVAADLEQALDNLLDNALRVAPAGSSVRLEAGEEDGWVVVHVVDEGPGMPPEDRLHAFDRFWTRKAERGRGSGLGLAIVSRLVHNSGGEVELRDGPGGVGIDAVVRLRPR